MCKRLPIKRKWVGKLPRLRRKDEYGGMWVKANEYGIDYYHYLNDKKAVAMSIRLSDRYVNKMSLTEKNREAVRHYLSTSTTWNERKKHKELADRIGTIIPKEYLTEYTELRKYYNF